MRRNIFRRRLYRTVDDLRPATSITVGRGAGDFRSGDVIGLLGGEHAIVRKVESSTTLRISRHWRLWRISYWLRDNWPLLVLYATLALGLVVWVAAFRWWLR